MSGSIVTALRPLIAPLIVELARSPELQELLRSPELRPLLDVLRDALGPASPPASPHVTVQEYADALGICASTVRTAFNEGRLEGQRIGRAIRIRRDAVIGPPAAGRAAPDAMTPAAIAERILARGAR